jgi:hypothetical protein
LRWGIAEEASREKYVAWSILENLCVLTQQFLLIADCQLPIADLLRRPLTLRSMQFLVA